MQWLQLKKKCVVIYYNFRHTFVPCRIDGGGLMFFEGPSICAWGWRHSPVGFPSSCPVSVCAKIKPLENGPVMPCMTVFHVMVAIYLWTQLCCWKQLVLCYNWQKQWNSCQLLKVLIPYSCASIPCTFPVVRLLINTRVPTLGDCQALLLVVMVAHLANTLLEDEESARNNHIFACNFARYSPISIFFTLRLRYKPFLIWLLTTPLRLKYVATLPCNLSLLACFADSNVSQGSLATYARCDGICSIHLTANLPKNLPVKKIVNPLRLDRIMVMSLWPRFLAYIVYPNYFILCAVQFHERLNEILSLLPDLLD